MQTSVPLLGEGEYWSVLWFHVFGSVYRLVGDGGNDFLVILLELHHDPAFQAMAHVAQFFGITFD